jgi:hypothetical protein
MLSTTVEPECRQRPFVISWAVTGPRGGVAADTVGPRRSIGAGAGDAPERIAPKVLTHSTIHPEADPVDVFGDRRASSPAVH